MYETIDNYFEGRLLEADKAAFEAQLAQDSLLADEVAFHLGEGGLEGSVGGKGRESPFS